MAGKKQKPEEDLEKPAEEVAAPVEEEDDHEEIGQEAEKVLAEDDEAEDLTDDEAEDDAESDGSEQNEDADSAEGKTEKGDKSAKGDQDKKGKKGKKRDRKRRDGFQKVDPSNSPKIKKIASEIEKMDDLDLLKQYRDQYNNETRDLINKIKKIQIEITNIQNQAREYKAKRDDLNKQVQDLKKDKRDLQDKLSSANEEFRKAKEEKKQSEDHKKQGEIRAKIRRIRKDIDTLEKKIETEDMAIHEENKIVDEIAKLEHELQELQKQTAKPVQFKEQWEEIRNARDGLKNEGAKLKELAEASQNYHLLFLDVFKELDELRNEKMNLQRDLNENRYIADMYHQRLIDLGQRVNQQKKLVRKMAFQNQKKVKKEIQALTLKDAKDKMKKGEKLNLFEARALFESNANTEEQKE
jgi:uncharacterized coiled-coil DUF342 family protein